MKKLLSLLALLACLLSTQAAGKKVIFVAGLPATARASTNIALVVSCSNHASIESKASPRSFTAMAGPTTLEDAIVGVGQDRILRTNFGRDIALDLMGDYTLSDVALNIDKLDMSFLKRSMCKHSSGLSLLSHPVQQPILEF